MSFLCPERTRQEEAVPPPWRPPSSYVCLLCLLCLKHISKVYCMCFPEPGETAVHLATSSLEVTWGQLHSVELLLAILSFCFLISDFLPGPLWTVVNALPVSIRKPSPSILLRIFQLWLDKAEYENNCTIVHLFFKCLIRYSTSKSCIKILR